MTLNKLSLIIKSLKCSLNHISANCLGSRNDNTLHYLKSKLYKDVFEQAATLYKRSNKDAKEMNKHVMRFISKTITEIDPEMVAVKKKKQPIFTNILYRCIFVGMVKIF